MKSPLSHVSLDVIRTDRLPVVLVARPPIPPCECPPVLAELELEFVPEFAVEIVEELELEVVLVVSSEVSTLTIAEEEPA